MGEDERSVTNVRIEPGKEERDVLASVTRETDGRFLLDRLRRGARRGRVFLAFAGPDPVGHVYLRLEEAEEPELRERLPKTPLIQRLRVRPEFRLQGVGSALVAAAERGALLGRRRRIALGVDVDQPEPIGFYLRIGYREWPYGKIETFNDETGEREFCRIFVKELRTG